MLDGEDSENELSSVASESMSSWEDFGEVFPIYSHNHSRGINGPMSN